MNYETFMRNHEARMAELNAAIQSMNETVYGNKKPLEFTEQSSDDNEIDLESIIGNIGSELDELLADL